MFLSSKTRQQPQEQAEPHAENNAGHNRKIKRGVLAFVDDVSRQTSQTKWQFPAKIEERTKENEQAAQHQQHASEFARGIHEYYIL
jgi:hypothetical protein